MLTNTALRSQVDALWLKPWSGGLANPSDAIVAAERGSGCGSRIQVQQPELMRRHYALRHSSNVGARFRIRDPQPDPLLIQGVVDEGNLAPAPKLG